MPLVVVGETGLIGRAIINKSNDDYLEFKINQWTNENLSISLRNLETSWIKYKEPIDLVWAAGKSSNSSNQETLDFEIELVNNFLNLISNSDIELRSLSLISSAGSIFGGYDNQIITEDSIPKPISLYGKSRLEIESRFSSYAIKSGTLLNIFRLTNVFGMRQTLKNDSGLLSHLIAANLTRKELNIFVPLFVEQDYIDVDFVADNINQILRKCRISNNQIQHFIFSRNQSHSIAELISLIDKFMGRKTPFVTREIETGHVRQSNLKFQVKNQDFISTPIDQITFSVRKLVNEMIYAKVS
jgi:nucleoside-diphosphate-sugar epimerase